MNNKILYIIEDSELFDSCKAELNSQFEITVAYSRNDAFEILQSKNTFACIIIESRIFDIKNIEFFNKHKAIIANSQKILIVEEVEQEKYKNFTELSNNSTILSNKTPLEQFFFIINIALDSYQSILIEKENAEKAFKSSIRTLLEFLKLTQPEIYKESQIVSNIAVLIAKKLKLKKIWELELAALLYRIGTTVIPSSILNKKSDESNSEEKIEKMFQSIPETGYIMLSNIPRMKGIAKIVRNQRIENQKLTEDKIDFDYLWFAHLIKIVHEYYHRLKNGSNATTTISILKKTYSLNQKIVSALEEVLIDLKNEEYVVSRNKVNKIILTLEQDKKKDIIIVDKKIAELEPGFIIAQPIRDGNGRIILKEGYELSEHIITKLNNLATVIGIIEPIKIEMEAEKIKQKV